MPNLSSMTLSEAELLKKTLTSLGLSEVYKSKLGQSGNTLGEEFTEEFANISAKIEDLFSKIKMSKEEIELFLSENHHTSFQDIINILEKIHKRDNNINQILDK